MVKMISIHSSRGGTGKSLICSNISAILASMGRNIALLDFDFRAPSLLTIFQARNTVKKWVNDYLDGKAKLRDVMVDLTDRYKTGGRFLVGFANVEMDAMREIARKDRKWQMRALKRVMAMKEELAKLFEVDVIILDTSPGVQYSSVNAVVSSDVSVIVSSMDILDLEGAQRVVQDLYEPFEKKTFILVNKATPHMFMGEDNKSTLIDNVRRRFTQPVIAIIPCYCDILLAQRVTLFALDKPEHPFTWALTEVAKRLEA
ncbi:MAG: AAA family ATPase [Candidatus Bathyarchaeota archaeon]|nr:MAG: AAA family ATPase [Candidatus Bathyarchaeota archaeon]